MRVSWQCRGRGKVVLLYLIDSSRNEFSSPYSLWGLPDRSQLLGYLPWSVRLGRTQKTWWLLVVISLYVTIVRCEPPPAGCGHLPARHRFHSSPNTMPIASITVPTSGGCVLVVYITGGSLVIDTLNYTYS